VEYTSDIKTRESDLVSKILVSNGNRVEVKSQGSLCSGLKLQRQHINQWMCLDQQKTYNDRWPALSQAPMLIAVKHMIQGEHSIKLQQWQTILGRFCFYSGSNGRAQELKEM
jgi:hypothetical protein